MKKVTLYDVAKKSGVSPKTVSRVINNEASVSPGTRELVQSSIKTLGYHPNTSARSLRTSRSYLLALLYDNLSPAYVLDLQAGIQEFCEDAGFNIIIRSCDSESPDLVQDVSALFDHSRIDGLILSAPLTDHSDLLSYLDGEGKSYVRIAPVDTHARSPFVTVNDQEAAGEIVDYLVSLGHRSIGIIAGHPAHSASSERLAGYRSSLSRAGIPVIDDLIQRGDFSFESGELAAQELLERQNPPTAIFACNDYMAAGAMKVAHQMGMNVPEDLSLAGFDNAPVSRQVWPTLTTASQPVRQIASNSARLLVQRISDQETSITQLGFECQLMIRESTAAPCARSGAPAVANSEP